MLRPLNDRIIGRILPEANENSHSGIILSKEEDSGSFTVLVEAVGPGRIVNGEHKALSITVGDKVIVPKYAGSIITEDEKHSFIFQEKNVLAICE